MPAMLVWLMIFAVAVAAAVRSGNEPNPAEPPAPAGPEAFSGLFLPHQLAGGFSAVIQRVILSMLTDVSGTPTSLSTSCAHDRLLNGPGGAAVGVVEPLPVALPFEPVAPLCVLFPCVEVPPDEVWLLLSDEFELSDGSELSLEESELPIGPELSPEESELSVGPELSPEELELSAGPELSPDESELSAGELSPDESELSVGPELSVDGSTGASAVSIISVPSPGSPDGSSFGLR